MTDFDPNPYSGTEPITTGSISKSQNQPQPQRPQAMRSIYVQPGDTVNSISRAHNSTPSLIVSANNLEAPYGLKIGQKLLVPGAPTYSQTPIRRTSVPAPSDGIVTGSITRSSPVVPDRGEGLKRVDLPPPPDSGTGGNKDDIYYFHKVKTGDNLAAIAGKYKMDAAKLAKLNNISPTAPLRTGQIIKVPI